MFNRIGCVGVRSERAADRYSIRGHVEVRRCCIAVLPAAERVAGLRRRLCDRYCRVILCRSLARLFSVNCIDQVIAVDRPVTLDFHILGGHGLHFTSPTVEGVTDQARYRCRTYRRAICISRFSWYCRCSGRHFFICVAVSNFIAVDRPNRIQRDVFIYSSRETEVVSVQLPLLEGVTVLCRSGGFGCCRPLVDCLSANSRTTVAVERYSHCLRCIAFIVENKCIILEL